MSVDFADCERAREQRKEGCQKGSDRGEGKGKGTYSNSLQPGKLQHCTSELVQRLRDATFEIAQTFDACGKVLIIGSEIFNSSAELRRVDVAKRNR